jgi:hypothetical protein
MSDFGDIFKSTINKSTGKFFYDPWVISDEYKDTVWNDILNTLPVSKGEARVILLKPGQCYQSHSDIDDRYHLNIIGDFNYLIDLDSETMYRNNNDCKWYLLDTGSRHTAMNVGETVRAQLVVRKLLLNNILNEPVKIKLSSITLSPDDARYKFDDVISGWLNRANKTGIINDFNPSLTHVTFNIENNCLTELEQIIPTDFRLEIL